MNQLKIPNFKRGMRVDNIDEDDQILSLRNMVNADIDFRTGAAVRRNGYSYFIQTLAAQAKQIFEFYDTVGRSNLLLIMDEKLYWYRSTDTTLYEVKNTSVSPTTSLDFATYDHYPFLTAGDRCFFADDNGFWWVDNTSLVWEYPPTTPLPLCYQVGIDVPTDDWLEDNVTIVEDAGQQQNIMDTDHQLDATFKVAQSFTIPADSVQPVDGVIVTMRRTGNPAGFIRAHIETDDSNSPSGTLADVNLQSRWQRCVDIALVDTDYNLDFQSVVHLTGGASGTKYWMVLEPDPNYNGGGGTHIDVRYNSAGGYSGGDRASWNGAAWAVNAGTDLRFGIGLDLDVSKIYWYKLTYRNSTYGIESDGARIYAGSTSQAGFKITFPSTLTDGQVTHIRMYREDLTSEDAKSVDLDSMQYDYIGEIEVGDTDFYDLVETGGAELQTADHTRLTDRDDNLIVPRHLEWWQHRIWAVPAISDTFYYSKRLEEAGATGIAGDPVYDYFPQEASYRNDWDVNSTIIAMKVHEGRLIIYTDRHDTHIFSGANQPLNPPPDLYHEHIIIGEGVLDSRGLVDLRGKHVFVTQDREIKGFIGSIDMEDISDVMDSVLAGLTTIHAFVWNNQYMLLGDSNADGVMDTIYILDLSRRTISPWRKYEYKNGTTIVEIKDVILTNAGVLYAVAKMDSTYHIIQLNSGTSDGWTTLENDGTAIVKTLQTHDIRPAKRAFWQEVGIRGYYPTSTIPTYVTTCTDLTGETTTSAFDPSSSEDMLGHAHGLRMASYELSLKIESTGVEKDEIRELFVRYRL